MRCKRRGRNHGDENNHNIEFDPENASCKFAVFVNAPERGNSSHDKAAKFLRVMMIKYALECAESQACDWDSFEIFADIEDVAMVPNVYKNLISTHRGRSSLIVTAGNGIDASITPGLFGHSYGLPVNEFKYLVKEDKKRDVVLVTDRRVETLHPYDRTVHPNYKKTGEYDPSKRVFISDNDICKSKDYSIIVSDRIERIFDRNAQRIISAEHLSPRTHRNKIGVLPAGTQEDREILNGFFLDSNDDLPEISEHERTGADNVAVSAEVNTICGSSNNAESREETAEIEDVTSKKEEK